MPKGKIKSFTIDAKSGPDTKFESHREKMKKDRSVKLYGNGGTSKGGSHYKKMTSEGKKR